MFSVRIQAEAIATDPFAALPPSPACGAVVRFCGKVRSNTQGAPLTHLVLEHFPHVTEAAIERILMQARERWKLQQALVVHRVGRIAQGEDIVVIQTASAHRHDAYEANAFIMDYLKTEAPLWKQECLVDGSAQWVEARASDQQAQQRWQRIAHAPTTGYRIGALVLAGGQGSRMGYVNKGLQPLHGKPLVQHVLDRLCPQVDYLALSANQDLETYRSLGLPVFTDAPQLQGQGPLAGIASALPRFPHDLDALLVVPCDTPLLPDDLVTRLADALFALPSQAAVMAATTNAPQPSVFLCRPAALPSLVGYLLDPAKRKLHGWLKNIGCSTVVFDDATAFANVNDLPTLQALQHPSQTADAPGSMAAHRSDGPTNDATSISHVRTA